MWYLIAPPIIIVLSVFFVLWYLSRKGVDPVVVDKISQLENTASEKIAFARTKTFFLRLLEKMTSRFKVFSLKMHNILNEMTQSLKEKQKHFQKEEVKKDFFAEEKEEENILDPEVPLIRKRQNLHIVEENLSVDSSDISVMDVREEKKENDILVEEKRVRPMVSEVATRPEKILPKKKSVSVVREETLIAHIAVNPKDFSAYEELGDYYLENGNIKDAKECYRQVLRLSPVQRMAKIKIRRLEKILSQK